MKTTTYNQNLARIIVTAAIVLSFVLTIFILAKPATGKEQGRTKYFKSIEIEAGDSLWSIAETYMSEEYDNITEYIDELKSMNGLTEDTIHEGRCLVVAYYSDEIK